MSAKRNVKADRKSTDSGSDDDVVVLEAETKSSTKKKTSKRGSRATAATAETMAAKQRDISISEFFAKNRHLLGFDNPRKALLTAVKEAVDNSLDACEEAHILPDITITIKLVDGYDNRFTLNVTDNGPGIVKKQIPNIFARLLYGSKFHSLKMSRGQQGIGISAAGMYGLITTGEPVKVISRTSRKKPAHKYHLQIDTSKNKPHIVLDEECDFDQPRGTSVTITLEGKYLKGKQSVDEYISQTAMANPHTTIIYNAPGDVQHEFRRKTKELPFIPIEIKPHPYGVELGLMYKMSRESKAKKLDEFLHKEFSRVSKPMSRKIVKEAKLLSIKPSTVNLKQIEQLHEIVNNTKIMAPSSDCIGPIGEQNLVDGLKRVYDANFYSSCTRKALRVSR